MYGKFILPLNYSAAFLYKNNLLYISIQRQKTYFCVPFIFFNLFFSFHAEAKVLASGLTICGYSLH
jgi:hypothetical protein